jgi:superoxide dismutase, Fe-Mn family
MAYTPKDFSQLIGTPGFSETLLKNHFKLYEGYVTNVNKLADLLKTTEGGTPPFAELKRRIGWEFNGMRLHELYFGNLAKAPQNADAGSKLAKQIAADFGSTEAWEKDFKATCTMRGIGWVLLTWDREGKKLFNIWVNEHDTGHLAGCAPILVADVFEHAFITDYGLNRADYVQALVKALDWAEASKRFDAS